MTTTPLQRLITKIFGGTPAFEAPLDADADTAKTRQLQPNIATHRARKPLARNDVGPDALRRAAENFIHDEARAYIAWCPSTRYRVDLVVTQITPENRHWLEDVQALKPAIRNKIALACLRAADGAAETLDTSAFCGWHIEPATDSSVDDRNVYTVLACLGTDQISMNFTLYGDYVEADPGEPAKVQAGRDRTATLDLAGRLPAAPLLMLRIREPGQPERTQPVTQLPALIGRGSACNVQLDSPYVSRFHARISAGPGGELMLENSSPKGTLLDGDGLLGPVALAAGTSHALPGSGSLAIAPALGSDAVHIAFERPGARSDGKVTLDLPSSHPASSRASRLPTVNPAANAPPAPFASPKALARLQVRHAGGSIEEHLIHDLPVLIGREPEGVGMVVVVDDPACHVSRTHLCIERLQGTSFRTVNLGHGKGNSWYGSEMLGQCFAWRIEPAGTGGGWVLLGQGKEKAGAVMARIEQVQ